MQSNHVICLRNKIIIVVRGSYQGGDSGGVVSTWDSMTELSISPGHHISHLGREAVFMRISETNRRLGTQAR